MIYIHPFPARMAPDIALSKISSMRAGQKILDPMSGSGMVLSQASRKGLNAYGYDLDPLARLISKVGSTKVEPSAVKESLESLITLCIKERRKKSYVKLPWVTQDKETQSFIDYWFYSKQQKDLCALSYWLVANPFIKNENELEVLKIALSRLIVSKEPKASLARDTAHSRPHRVITENSFDILAELPGSVEHVLKALEGGSIKLNAKTYLGDARKMEQTKSGSIDAIITSPPYLNAIDYLRGHRLSLVWMGYTISQLRNIRGESIGSERSAKTPSIDELAALVKKYDLGRLRKRNCGMLFRYYADLKSQLNESYRVLKAGGSATYVIGNSNLEGCYIPNSELLKKAALSAGLIFAGETIRDIPDNKRYLPINLRGNQGAERMKTEHIIEFVKI